MTDIDDLDDCPEPWRSEIERLRHHYEQTAQELDHERQENDRLRGENERLKTALAFAAEWGVDSDMGCKNPVSAALRHWIKGGMYSPLTTKQKGKGDD